MKIGIGAGKYIELANDRASFHGMSREEAIELVEEALERGSANGKPLGEKCETRETLQFWLQMTNEDLEQDAKIQKIEVQIDEVLRKSNEPKRRKEMIKPILRGVQYKLNGLSEDEE